MGGDNGPDNPGDTSNPEDRAAPGANPQGAEPAGAPGAASPASGQAAAAQAVLVDVLGRMFTKEANAASRAAKGNGFDSWLAEFYAEHQETLTAALALAAAVLGACPGR